MSWWLLDGRGWPGELAGENVPIASRIAQLAEVVEVANRVGGPQAAAKLARERRGKQFDRALATVVAHDAELVLSGLEAVSSWEAVVDAEPALAVVLSADRFDEALDAIPGFVDLKSPYFLGHARAVADLAADAGGRLGLPADDLRLLRRAGLMHDLGRLGVSNAILGKRGPLGAGEWDDDRAEDGRQPGRTHLRNDRRPDARSRGDLRDAARALPEEEFPTRAASGA